VTISIDVQGYDEAVRRVGSMDARIRKAMVEQIQRKEVPPAAARMRGKASSRIMQRAASTVRVEMNADGASIRGGGGGLGGTLFAGAEFGGRQKRTTYPRRSRGGGAHVVHRRRTTMMFLPHLGSRGYFFWPSIRETFTGIAARTARTVQQEVDRG
jgi:hypothetical protein